jgi:hypothetical protein
MNKLNVFTEKVTAWGRRFTGFLARAGTSGDTQDSEYDEAMDYLSLTGNAWMIKEYLLKKSSKKKT